MTTTATPPFSLKVCETAWDALQSTIEYLALSRIINKKKGTVIVLDPRMIDRPKDGDIDKVFDASIIFKGIVGDTEDNKYTEIALGKALLTWRHRLPSSVIQQLYPYLLKDGDTIWGGSTIDAGGLIVAFSGVQQVYDEMISEMMASMIRGIARDAMTDDNGVLNLGVSFIGEMHEPIQG